VLTVVLAFQPASAVIGAGVLLWSAQAPLD
jgi:hypothetical protein